jgi:serine/threonine protein kinase
MTSTREARVFKAAPLDVGDVVADRYRVEEGIGAGGMGVVYRAFDLELEEQLAIKVLQLAGGDDERQVVRFKQEIKLARKIVHPNVCRIYDFGSWRELKFVTMELLRGETLDVYVARHDLDLDGKLELFRGILAGLRAAHELQIVHRDLKPPNVMVTGDRRPVIMDFGLARDLEATSITSASEVFGTPSFTAPESLMGQTVDHRCDVYSLGVILFELACGSKPYAGKTVFDVAQKQLREDPPRPRDLVPELPVWLDRAILKMLARDPGDRFQSVAEILLIFELAAGAGSSAGIPAPVLAPPSSPPGTKKVLIVDDDEVFLTIVEAHLKPTGLQVVTASDGAAGLAALHREQPDLVCLDFRMPEMDGFHVAGYIGQLEPGKRPPIFMTTAIQDPQYAKQAARLGIERFFTKPVDARELADAIRERLGPCR